MKKLLTWTSLFFAGFVTEATADVVEYDNFKNSEWNLSEQFVNNRFDACVARKLKDDGGHGFSIGRAISGDDFVFVHGMQALVGADESKAKGKVYINGKTGYDYSDMEVLNSAVNPGTKYITIYLADGFIDNLATANSVDVEFSQGRSSHGLKGSRDIISRLNACMDSGLVREMAAVIAPLQAPTGWTSGTSTEGSGGRYLAIELPPPANAPFGQKLFMAYAENDRGTYDIRLRDNAAALATSISPSAESVKRVAASVNLGTAQVFTTLITYVGTAIDIPDVLPADLSKLSLAGPMTLKSLDASVPNRVDMSFTAEAALGAAAIQSAPVPGALNLDGLVGRYFVRGKNPDGKPYYGTADTKMENGTLRIDWVWRNKKTDTAQSNLIGNVLTAIVPGLPDPAVYTIGKDGVWRGTWQKGAGLEWMVPRP